jgi:hypothetical protein
MTGDDLDGATVSTPVWMRCVLFFLLVLAFIAVAGDVAPYFFGGVLWLIVKSWF